MKTPSRFPRTTRSEWESLVATSGVDPASLASRSDDGVAVGPIYPAGEGRALPGRPPGIRWIPVQRVDLGSPDDVVAAIRASITGGTSGIAIVFRDSAVARGHGVAFDPTDLPGIIGESGLAGGHVRIDAGEAHQDVLAEIVSALSSGSVGDLCIACDPFATLARHGYLARPPDEALTRLLTATRTMETAGLSGEAFVADSRPWHDGGASEAQELAATLGAVVGYLRQAEAHGLLDPAAHRLGVILSADADQFLTIARFRAMRLLIGRVLEMAGLADRGVRIHAETSWRMISRRDPNMNLLRATTASFAAAVGGAASITVLPSTLDGGRFADRMARNIQAIAIEESSLHRVADPGAGSGAVESLTSDIAAAAWDEFRRIEAEGGMAESLRSGALQRRIASVRDARLDRVARRQIELVGVNVHADASTPLPAASPVDATPRPPEQTAETVATLLAIRLAEPFELLCDRARALKEEGYPAHVVVVGIGSPASIELGVAEARGAFASADLSPLAITAASPESAATGFAESGAVVACLVTGEREPASSLNAIVSALRNAGAAQVILAGTPAPGRAIPPAFDASLEPDTDLPALLARMLDVIAIGGKNGQNRAIQAEDGAQDP